MVFPCDSSFTLYNAVHRLLTWFFVHCRLEYIRMGSPQDQTWRDFPRSLTEVQGARHYVTLFEAPFVASELEGHESKALRAGSLLAIPVPPPGSKPLPGAPLAELTSQNLAQWADRVQEVASHMRLPPRAATDCPTTHLVGILSRLEGMTHTPYCRRCFGVGQQCRCVVAPCRATSPATALWTPPIVSYVAMASATQTTASSSAGVAPPPEYPALPMPQLEPMETSPPLTMEELLLMARVGRGGRGWTPPQTPTAPGLRQARPRTPQLQVPILGRQGATAQTPYRQQVVTPPTLAPRSRATPSASQSQGRERPTAGETKRRGRSSSHGPHNR